MSNGSREGVHAILENIKRRTFRIRYQNDKGKMPVGTAFAVGRGGREYLVTAHHVVDGIKPGWFVEVLRDGVWRSDTYSIVGTGPARKDGCGNVDVAVLRLKGSLPAMRPVTASSDGLAIGQPVNILGFPSEEGGPSALTTVSGPFLGFEDEDLGMVIEATVSEGFSGGPVVFVPEGPPPSEVRIAGVLVSRPRRATEPPTAHAYDIRRAFELIDAWESR